MKKTIEQIRERVSVVALAICLALAGTAVAFTKKAADEPKTAHAAVNVPLDETSVPRAETPRDSFAPIINKVAPAVVKIEVTTTVKNTATEQWRGFEDPFWRHFFGDQFGRMFPEPPSGPFHEHGLGSGVIVTKDGYILTNNHVVDNASDLKVTLQDGREFSAKVVGRDPKSDIAVIKIDAQNLPVVPMADSDKVQVGDRVLAIGNPFGVGQTVTQGIVSAKDRGNVGIEHYENFIQTDAAINPGNSGGALVDVEGRLIGINTAILSRSGGSQGVGFAIPSDLARNVMESLVQYGHVTRGYLGVMIQDLNPTLAQEFKLKGTSGALIGDVVPDGPAARAGLKDGDVLLEFNHKPVTDSRHLQLTVTETKPGTIVPVKVWRDGTARTMEITVKTLKENEPLAQNNNSKNGQDTGTLNGVAVSDLDQAARDQFNVPKTVKGAVITEVKPDSAAAEAGLKPGDVIEEINRHPVNSADQAVRLTEHAKDKHTLVRIWEKGGSRYVVVNESGQLG